MKRKTCDPNLKVLASIINCGVVTLTSLPIYFLVGLEQWKAGTVLMFFLYNILFRKRCLGCMVAGTVLERPASVRYAALYSTSFASLFFYVYVPFDLLVANGLCCQIPCLALTGNTLHGFLGGQWTVREA